MGSASETFVGSLPKVKNDSKLLTRTELSKKSSKQMGGQQATKEEIDKLLLDKLPGILDEDQKKTR